MHRNSHLLLCTFAVLVMLTSGLLSAVGQPLSIVDSGQEPAPTRTRMMSYEPHGFIVIGSNGDFETQGWPGNGTESDPYVIENLNITSTEVGISISHTSVCFEIRNCIISSIGQSSRAGILLSDAVNGTVRDTIIERHYHGIHVQDSPGSTLTNNTTNGNTRYGFYLYSSGSSSLTNNTARNNSYHGFCLLHSASCVLTNNTARNNTYHGFYLGSSGSCNLADNTAGNNSFYGSYVVSSDSCSLMNNTVGNNELGFCLLDSPSCSLMSNIVSNNEIGFALYYSESCNLTLNMVTDNSQYGISIGTGSSHNMVYQNLIGYNGLSNALDNGGSNSWDDGVSLGNYWSDYSDTGGYSIAGSAGSVDRFPFKMTTITTTTTATTTPTQTGTKLPLSGEIMILMVAGGATIAVLIMVVYAMKNRGDIEARIAIKQN